MFKRIKTWWERYERRLSATAFVVGFLFDNLTLQQVDRLSDNLILALYLIVALCAVLFLNTEHARGSEGAPPSRWRAFPEFLLPFALGGLFSGFLIFYSRSGSLLASAPFLLILFLLFVGNEFLRRHYQRFIFQLCVLFVTLFSYSVLVVPVVLRRMGDGIFLLSGVVALALFSLFLEALKRVNAEEFQNSRRVLLPVVVMIYILFNFLYFNNMIPPIPLSLKEVGVYHAIERTRSGAYLLSYEAPRWYEFGDVTSATLHIVPGESVLGLSSVYAPAALTTDIVHRFEYFDTAGREWRVATEVRFPISGGRLEGFRGYSQKDAITEGRWRLSVETERGQVIGRFAFTVIFASSTPPLETVAR